LSLVFTVFTHKSVFVADRFAESEREPRWSVRKALIVLVLATVTAALESALLVDTVSSVSKSLGMSEAFIGLVIIAVLTNVAEKIAAITYALRNKIDLSLSIGMNSANQVALFAVPVMVILSAIMGKPMDMVFSAYELVAMVASVVILNHMTADGDCHWLEGAQLLAVYFIIVVTFYFV
jgi:Ca2+:H+ antiporter